MIEKRKAPESLNCYRHRHIPAITSCVRCRRKICASCVDSAVKYPHLCPTCYGIEYDSLQVQRKRDRKKALKQGVVAAIVVVALLILLPIMNWTIDKRIEEKPEAKVEASPVANAYLIDDDVYLDLKDFVYTKSTNKVNLNVKIYLTNYYETGADNIKIELLMLKNTTIRQEGDVSIMLIPSNQSTACYFTGLTLTPGNYFAHFILWKADKVYRQVRLSFVLTDRDVSSVSRLGESALNAYDPYPVQPDPVAVNKRKVVKEDILDNFFAFLPLLILVLVIEAVIIGLVIFARENSFVAGNIYANIPYEDIAPPARAAPPAPPKPHVDWAPEIQAAAVARAPDTEPPQMPVPEQAPVPEMPTPDEFKAEQESAMVEAIQLPQTPPEAPDPAASAVGGGVRL